MKKSIAVILLGSAFVLPHTSHAEAATLNSVQVKTDVQVISSEAGIQKAATQALFSKDTSKLDPYALYQQLWNHYKKQYEQHAGEKPSVKPEKPSVSVPQPEQPSAPEAAPQKPVPAPQPEKPQEKPQEKPDTNQPSAPQEKPDQQAGAGQVSASQIEKAVLDLTNAERQKAGLKPLQMDDKLMASARQKSADMASKNYFSHTSPTYGSPFDQMKANGITYKAAAENIAMGQRSAQEVVQGWMNSPGHRQNILTPGFTHIGIGYDANGNYWTQQFIQK